MLLLAQIDTGGVAGLACLFARLKEPRAYVAS